MIDSDIFYDVLVRHGISFFTGVPDSLLKSFLSVLELRVPARSHIIAVNEGNAIALAAGHHLATGNMPLVYIQNSGIGNVLNPILSLADSSLYGIPMVVLVGWRGFPGSNDAIQHQKQGAVLEDLLKAVRYNYAILDVDTDLDTTVSTAIESAKRQSQPFFMLVPPQTLTSERHPIPVEPLSDYPMSRKEIMSLLVESLENQAIVCASTGYLSRELLKLRQERGEEGDNDFLMTGAMGHVSALSLGIALEKPNCRVYCIDGDGSMLMHAGALGTIGKSGANNFVHILCNNGVHATVGGQETGALEMNWKTIAESYGYRVTRMVKTEKAFLKALQDCRHLEGPILLDVRYHESERTSVLPRPTESLRNRKKRFMEAIQS